MGSRWWRELRVAGASPAPLLALAFALVFALAWDRSAPRRAGSRLARARDPRATGARGPVCTCAAGDDAALLLSLAWRGLRESASLSLRALRALARGSLRLR
jgi:hypothetical protein